MSFYETIPIGNFIPYKGLWVWTKIPLCALEVVSPVLEEYENFAKFAKWVYVLKRLVFHEENFSINVGCYWPPLSKRVLTVLVEDLSSLSPQNAQRPTAAFAWCWTVKYVNSIGLAQSKRLSVVIFLLLRFTLSSKSLLKSSPQWNSFLSCSMLNSFRIMRFPWPVGLYWGYTIRGFWHVLHLTLVRAFLAFRLKVVFVSVRKIHATLFLPRTIESVKKVLKNLSPLLKWNVWNFH